MPKCLSDEEDPVPVFAMKLLSVLVARLGTIAVSKFFFCIAAGALLATAHGQQNELGQLYVARKVVSIAGPCIYKSARGPSRESSLQFNYQQQT